MIKYIKTTTSEKLVINYLKYYLRLCSYMVVLPNRSIKYIKDKYKLLIGEKTAEEIKIDFANVYKPNKKLKREVKGRNLITGLPSSIEITQDETQEALRESIEKIVQETTSVLEQSDPELSADIVEKGIVLTGGGSLLKGLLNVLEQELKRKILLSKEISNPKN